VTLKESNAKFNFNFKDVYWNSRLQMEHSRLIDFIKSSAVEENDNNSKVNIERKISDEKLDKKIDKKIATDKTNNDANDKKQNIPKKKKKKVVVADMMAGVGPFGVPLAMNDITVHANDLNPESYKYLDKNVIVNHCEKFLHTYNSCGR
jgi:tRNA G37 N-methylase Trm5